MKTVLGLLSSPRKLGNSEIMTKEIMRHSGSDNRFQILRLQDLYIEPCMACYSCKKPGKKCPRKDDMPFLFNKINEVDAIIMSSPVYNWGANIGIQKLIDRLFLFSEWTESFANKPCVTFVTYGVPYEEGYALNTLNALARELNFHVKETDAFLGSSPGEVLKYQENLASARLLGQSLFDPLYKRKGRNFECPNCFSSIIKFRSDMHIPSPEVRAIGRVECAFCGTEIEIKYKQGGVEWRYLGKGLYTKGVSQKLNKFHAKTLKSFFQEKDKIKNLIEKYKNMDVEILSPIKE